MILSHYNELSEDTEPQFDGLDKDGFVGGDQRFNVWPTTVESALQALGQFVSAHAMGEIRDYLSLESRKQ